MSELYQNVSSQKYILVNLIPINASSVKTKKLKYYMRYYLEMIMMKASLTVKIWNSQAIISIWTITRF